MRKRVRYNRHMRLRTRMMLLIERLLLSPIRELTWRTSANSATPMVHLRHMAARDAAEFIAQHTSTALLYTHRFQLMDFAASLIPTEGWLLEFGVFQGESLDYFASKLPGRRLHGFDSFIGLQENWGGSDKPANAFDLAGRLPKVPRNCQLVPGWFDESLPAWLEENRGPVAFLHIDSDTYEACRTVLSLLSGRITKDTIILFDEHHGYPGWRHGEYKALQEFLAANKVACTYLGFSDAGAVIKIIPA